MPNHLHLVIDHPKPGVARELLRIELRAFTRRHFPGVQLWIEVPPPKLLRDRVKLRTEIRYVHLNPCRKGLTRDPLDWEWSTHREIVGAVQPGWLDLPALTRLWGVRSEEFARVFHSYVSSDPSVKVEGTPLPVARRDSLIVSVESVALAVLIATRTGRLVQRRGGGNRRRVVHLVSRFGKLDDESVARVFGITPRRVRGLARETLDRDDQAVLDAARMVLSDERLSKVRGARFPMAEILRG